MDELIDLIEGQETTDGMGNRTVRPNGAARRTVFAEIRSIGMTEYYRAMAYDRIPDLKAVVHPEEYHDEPFVAYEGRTYAVKRTYRTDNEKMELTCERVKA